MARSLRIECENTFYHLLSRGHGRQVVFRDDRDFLKFVELLGDFSQRFDVETWAYVLMGNHYHLVVKTRKANLSQAMQWLGAAYVNWFNARHHRDGSVFRGRFKAFVVGDDDYLRRLLLYVHRNPLRAGIVERLATYRWSSYGCLAYGRRCRPWLRRADVLRLFQNDPTVFRRRIQEYSDEKGRLFEDLWHGVFLGSRDDVAAFGALHMPGAPHPEKPQTRSLRRAGSVAEVVARLSSALGLSESDVAYLRRPLRHVKRPLRDVLIYLVWRQGDFGLREIGEYFNVGDTAIGNAHVRGRGYAEGDRRIRKQFERFLNG